MFGVCAILIVAFAALAIVGPARADQTLQVADRAQAAAAPSIKALPATGEEDKPLESQLAPQDAVARNAAVEIVGMAGVELSVAAFENVAPGGHLPALIAVSRLRSTRTAWNWHD